MENARSSGARWPSVYRGPPTVLFVLFGVNDISCGNYAGDEYRRTFLDYLIRIVDASRARKVRVYVLTYPVTSGPVEAKAADPYSRFLATLNRDRYFIASTTGR